MNSQTLTVGGIIQNGFLTGLKNAASLVGAIALWALTIWIPYINVGTTIGLLGLIAAMSKGEVISPTVIFKSDYRKQMGEFFLVQAFIAIGVTIGMMFFVIPGMVIAMAWGLAPLLVIDQAMNPTEALQKSNDLTAGKKWIIFFGMVLTYLTVGAAVMLLSTLFSKIHVVLGGLIALAGFVMVLSVMMGAQAHVYGALTGSAPPPTREVNQMQIVGGAIGTVVVSIILVAVIGMMSRPSKEDFERSAMESYRKSTEQRLEKARAAAAAPTRAADPAMDLSNDAAPETAAAPAREPSRVAPTIYESGRNVGTKKVASVKKRYQYR